MKTILIAVFVCAAAAGWTANVVIQRPPTCPNAPPCSGVLFCDSACRCTCDLSALPPSVGAGAAAEDATELSGARWRRFRPE